MLNPFPILFLAPLAYLLMRIVVGCVLIFFSHNHLRHRTEFAAYLPRPLSFCVLPLIILEFLLGAFLISGFSVQYTALATIALSVLYACLYQPENLLIPPRTTSLLLITMAISLFITGGGILAFDLPI